MGGPTAVYVVMVRDRHTDTTAEVFADAEDAINYARTAAREYATEPDDVEESDIQGWLYYARYSVEGDAVWVTRNVVR